MAAEGPLECFAGSRRGGRGIVEVTLDDLAREGSRQMIAKALELRSKTTSGLFADERDEDGKVWFPANGARGKAQAEGRVGDRGGSARPGSTTSASTEQPRAQGSARGSCRRTQALPKVNDVLPGMYCAACRRGFPPRLRSSRGCRRPVSLEISLMARLGGEQQAVPHPLVRFHQYAMVR